MILGCARRTRLRPVTNPGGKRVVEAHHSRGCHWIRSGRRAEVLAPRREFDSLQLHRRRVDQLVDRRSHTPKVAGSNPAPARTPWPSGKAAGCNPAIVGSIPTGVSTRNESGLAHRSCTVSGHYEAVRGLPDWGGLRSP